MSSGERPIVAVVLAVIGGALILVGGGMDFMMLSFDGMGFGMMDGFGGMMDGYRGMMDVVGFPYGMLGGFMLVSLVSGAMVIAGAVMMDIYPSQTRTWGIVVLVFSVVSFVGMGGFFVGAILGIAGGALALSWRRRP